MIGTPNATSFACVTKMPKMPAFAKPCMKLSDKTKDDDCCCRGVEAIEERCDGCSSPFSARAFLSSSRTTFLSSTSTSSFFSLQKLDPQIVHLALSTSVNPAVAMNSTSLAMTIVSRILIFMVARLILAIPDPYAKGMANLPTNCPMPYSARSGMYLSLRARYPSRMSVKTMPMAEFKREMRIVLSFVVVMESSPSPGRKDFVKPASDSGAVVDVVALRIPSVRRSRTRDCKLGGEVGC
mmetsp:Transcript_15032/g.37863  ORF Transcript_15032/g.37863 Transcript_15032/m.37863 type:complete len:239 (-) Transcript_15032:256-972(-)